jgi:hypothetical protein
MMFLSDGGNRAFVMVAAFVMVLLLAAFDCRRLAPMGRVGLAGVTCCRAMKYRGIEGDNGPGSLDGSS